MQPKHRKLLLLPLLAMLLVGCKPTPTPSPSEEEPTSVPPSITSDVEVTSIPPSVTSEVPPSSEVVSSSEVKTGPGYEGTDNYTLVESGVYGNRELDHAMGMTALDSVGTHKLLVVPVVFTDTTDIATPLYHSTLTKTFFGTSEDTGWESVASYYNKSSFGKLTIAGEVTDYYYLPWNRMEFSQLPNDMQNQQMGEGFYWDKTHHIIENIYNNLSAEKLKEYDSDNDGHVDALWMVYMTDIHALGGGDNDPFWAYKFYWNRYPNLEKPTPNVYAWASYKFANEGVGYDYEKPDAHTFIHETGHILGLPDYYDYDSLKAPAGQKDMMDHNVADHNIYSKFRLNWANPYHITGHADITLRPSESSGDFILIKDGWNGHAYDEYVLIEYFTPTGLNVKDGLNRGYETKGSTTYTKNFTAPGVRIWHVDSRLLTSVYDVEGNPLSTNYSDELLYDEVTWTRIGASNTASRSAEGYNLLHLLDGRGYTGNRGNWYKSVTGAGDTNLFQTGTTIAANDWLRYFQSGAAFNDGTPVGYSVTIGEMTAEGVQISIRKD